MCSGASAAARGPTRRSERGDETIHLDAGFGFSRTSARSRCGCRKRPARGRVKKRAKTRHFMVNSQEIAAICLQNRAVLGRAQLKVVGRRGAPRSVSSPARACENRVISTRRAQKRGAGVSRETKREPYSPAQSRFSARFSLSLFQTAAAYPPTNPAPILIDMASTALL